MKHLTKKDVRYLLALYNAIGYRYDTKSVKGVRASVVLDTIERALGWAQGFSMQDERIIRKILG
jgi:hypothetical protein